MRSRYQGLWATPNDQVRLTSIERSTVDSGAVERVVKQVAQHNKLIECEEMWAAHLKQQQNRHEATNAENGKSLAAEMIAEERRKQDQKRIAARCADKGESATLLKQACACAIAVSAERNESPERKSKKSKREEKERKKTRKESHHRKHKKQHKHKRQKREENV